MSRRMSARRKLAAIALSTLAFASCRPSASDSQVDAFSNRPTGYDRFIAIVKLRQAPLLTSKRVRGGKASVDPARAAALDAEQKAFLAQLARRFPEAKVIYRYRMVLNGFALVAPKKYEQELRAIAGTSYVEREQSFERLAPVTEAETLSTAANIAQVNSVAWIGAQKAREELGVDGKGVRVGVIDTGIDYTHKMFGGAGTEEAYKAVDVNHAAGVFPTSKVVGGIDLVGTAYDSAAPDFAKHLPIPDDNPLDEGGHGSHVAGTIAGIGDGVKTYTGVAPGASLYAIKVFGKEGSTGDAVIIAALEYAADPKGDLSLDEQLDVVNLSLGSEFGTPHLLYSEAMANLVKGGTLTIASGGNSGDFPYIVGAPGTTAEAISVAASIDNMDHNWKFLASAITFPDGQESIVEALEAAMAKPIKEAGAVAGTLVDVGLASTDLSPEAAEAVKGHVAFLQRGVSSFCDKAQRVEKAGAIGFVVANNQDGEPFVMGGDCKIAIPGIMISKALGEQIKAALPQGAVNFTFNSGRSVEKPQLIDTLTDFSSRGPRAVDGLIKPEVTAPGSNVISAKMGGGDEGVKFSGTSMAAPHVAGVAALLRSLRPGLSQESYKSLIMNTAHTLVDQTKKVYPIAQQGAGRVQVLEALRASATVTPAALSLGEVAVNQTLPLVKQLFIRNLGNSDAVYQLSSKSSEGLILNVPAKVAVKAGQQAIVTVRGSIKGLSTDNGLALEGMVSISDEATSTHLQVPVLALVSRQARLRAGELQTPNDAPQSRDVRLQNQGAVEAVALPFNLIAKDPRKATRHNVARNNICDLASAGYRVITKEIDGKQVSLLQIAGHLHDTVTTWNLCELSVQFDTDGDGIADQELLGTPLSSLSGNSGQVTNFVSALTDAGKMRQIRKDFEAQFPKLRTADYTPAILDTQDLLSFNHAGLVVVSADVSKLVVNAKGEWSVKIAMQIATEAGAPESDDFLGAKPSGTWFSIPADVSKQAYVDLPEQVSVAPKASTTLRFSAQKPGDLVIYAPRNAPSDAFFRRSHDLVVGGH